MDPSPRKSKPTQQSSPLGSSVKSAQSSAPVVQETGTKKGDVELYDISSADDSSRENKSYSAPKTMEPESSGTNLTTEGVKQFMESSEVEIVVLVEGIDTCKFSNCTISFTSTLDCSISIAVANYSAPQSPRSISVFRHQLHNAGAS